MKGFLISFEGGEGCGKSTQIKKFLTYLQEHGYDYICTREPGGTPVGEEIRNILLHSKDNLSAKTEFLLFSASRNKLIEEVVKPALDAGKIVVLDRFYDSSYTYQGYAGNLNIKDIKNITDFAIDGITPNLTILLDLDYKKGMERKSKDENLKNLDRIESKSADYHIKVREGYLKLARKNKKRIVIVNANDTIDNIAEKIAFHFENKYKSMIKTQK